MKPPELAAAAFSNLDAHDDTVESFSFEPASSRRTKAKVHVVLFRRWKNQRRLITFKGCANFEVVLDADVLAQNAPSNTCRLEAVADVAAIEALLRKHKRSWNVSYQQSIDPLPPKLAAAPTLVLFRVQLFGGVLLVLARSFAVKRLREPRAVQA